MASLPPPPPPPPGERGRGRSKPVCRYGKDCYQKNAEHLAKFAHPWLEESKPPFPSQAETAMRRLSTPPRKNDLDTEITPRSTATPIVARSRSRSPVPEALPGAMSSPVADAKSVARPGSFKPTCRYGKECYRKDPEHFEIFDHPGHPGLEATTSPASGIRSPRAPELPKLPERFRAGPSKPHPYSSYLGSDSEAGKSHPEAKSSEAWRSRIEEAFVAPSQPDAPPSAAAASASSHGSRSSGGPAPSSHLSAAPASAAPDAGTPRSAGTPRGAVMRKEARSEKDRGASDKDGPTRWGEVRSPAAGGSSVASRPGASGSAGAYTRGYGGSGGSGAKAGKVSYGYGYKRSSSSRVAAEDSDKSVASVRQDPWKDRASKCIELMRSLREQGSTMLPTKIVSTLSVSVGFIWTINAILLFAAIVKIAN